VTRAAVHGGTTTVIDFTRVQQAPSAQASIAAREEDWRGHAACDYAQPPMTEGALPPPPTHGSGRWPSLRRTCEGIRRYRSR